MKIAFFIDSSPTGGGYYHMRNFINLIKNVKSKNHSIVFITRNKLISELLNKIDIKNYLFKPSLFEKINLKLSRNNLVGKIFEIMNYYNPFHQFIKKNKIDYMVFNEPSFFTLYCKNLNFVSYVFNTEIDQVSHFEEFKKGNFERQKKIILFSVRYAKKIFVFTETNKQDLIEKYNCDSKKILIQNLIPYLPMIYEKNKEIDYKRIFRTQFEFSKNQIFIFYPAKFWEHKNHILILDTIKFFKKNEFNNITFIFSGGECKGNLIRIKKIIESENLQPYVKYIGNINEIELIAVYKYCDYVIIPSFIGRSSLPLLESLYFEKNIFYNKYILDKNLSKYTIGIDPKNAEDCYLQIKKYILDKNEPVNKKNNLSDIYKKLSDKEIFLNNFQNFLKNI